MSQAEILDALRQMPPEERLAIVEAALHMIREDMRLDKPATAEAQQMRDAATAMLADYTHDSELTSFTALDGEDFHAEE